MRIKEVSGSTGLTERTIRYYESVGLVIPNMEEKNFRLWRDYTPEHVRLLSAVATLRRASFRVEEISLLLSAPEKIPETVEKVRLRAEAARAEAEKLCDRLGQPDLREAADVVDLARQLEDTASAYELPPADRSFRIRGMDRYYREARSLSASLAVRLGVSVCVLWLLSIGLLTCVYAGDLGRQAARLSEDALEAFLEKRQDVDPASLPPLCFRPAESILAGKGAEFALPKAAMALDERGVVKEMDGFWTPSQMVKYFYKHSVEIDSGRIESEELWLAVAEGKLCFMVDPTLQDGTVRLPNVADGTFYRGFLTFRDAPLSDGSFSSGDADWYLPLIETKRGAKAGTYQTELVPYRSGTYDPGDKYEPGLFTPMFKEAGPALELLNGLDSGEYSFGADGLFQGSRLRGSWVSDGEGGRSFLLAAYGWSPLTMALRLLPGTYAVSLAIFLLFVLLLWLGLRYRLLRPLKELNGALEESLLEVSPEEFDYALPYRELRDLTGRYLLRRQMLTAALPSPPESAADLTELLDSARRKLLPLLDARRLRPTPEYRAESPAAATPEALEEALLALIREALPYGDQGEKLVLRTEEREGFLLAEAEVRTKAFRSGAYAALWEGIYRLPGGGDAPGAKLRKASAAIPGSFCAVRKIKHGLCLTLGLPAANERG